MNQMVDVLIVGGGAAGLSAALTLSRGGRSVIVSDNKQPRNAPAAHMNNFPSHDGTPPGEFRDMIKKDLQKYDACKLIDSGVLSIEKSQNLFNVTFSDQSQVTVKKVLLAHGVKDIYPDIPGVNAIFGKSFFFCPYCHGYEHRNSPIAIIAKGEVAFHLSAVVSGLTNDMMLFTNGPSDFSPEQILTIQKNNIRIVEDKISEFIHEGENLKAIKLINQEIIPRNYIFSAANFTLSSDIGVKLGCELSEMGIYAVDTFGKTSVEGVYAAGDIISMRHSVLMACASGQFAAAAMNNEIASENFKLT